MLQVRRLHADPIYRTDGMSIRGIGVRESMPPTYVSRPSTGDCLLMMFHGRVLLGPVGEQVISPAASIVIWRPGQWQAYGDPERRWMHSWIHCNGAFVTRTLRDACVPFGVAIPVVDPSAVDRNLFNLHEEILNVRSADDAIVRAGFVLLVRDATRSARGGLPRRPPPDDLARAMEMINSRYAEPLRLADLAAEAGLSVPHFVGRFHQHFGAPPIASLIRRRMEVAAALLKDTTDSIANIGRHVGYPDPAHFSKAFRNQFGTPPSQIRNTARRP